MKTERMIPVSTYRVQLNESFTLAQLEEILDYLEQSGITTIYASPIFDAVPGSMHGYDGICPHRINPAIGTLDDFRRVSASLKTRGMTWVQDIVPNHMALHPGNAWLMDALERGPLSPWYHFFDIDWEYPDPALHGRLMVPFLDTSLPEAITAKQVQFTCTADGFKMSCGELLFPLSAPAYEVLLNAIEHMPTPVRELLVQLQQEMKLPLASEEWALRKQALLHKWLATDELTRLLEQVNHHEALLALLLEQQYYLFTYWKEVAHKINYRRFFTVNGWITLKMEERWVFDTWHLLLQELYHEGLIQGLRIDHIDGLLDPAIYVRRLRETFGQKCYIIAEKILEENETLPQSWGLNGTTGYDFLSDVNGLLTNINGNEKISRFYRSHFPELAKYQQLVLNKKTMILQTQMGGEWNNLVHLLFHHRLAEKSVDQQKLKAALGLIMAGMPVYRIYPESWPLSAGEIAILEEALHTALQRAPALEEELGLIRSWWQEDYEHPAASLKFLKRLMQFTGPLTAKGVEDTVFYVYNALLSHNEVGDTPARHKCAPVTFHERCQQRLLQYPATLNATATHDTKRGEDARIRLNVLTLLPDLWIQQVQQWHARTQPFRDQFPDGIVPAGNDEYFIYQSIIAGFPGHDDPDSDFLPRLSSYIIKALRESKDHSNWSSPDEAYESRCLAFIAYLFAPENNLIGSLYALINKIDQHAATYSLSQLLLKLTAPGIPDTYQGCERWDFSFVDPDNRRPVNYIDRMNMLSLIQELEQDDPAALMKLLKANRHHAWEKFYVFVKALQFRKSHARLFHTGAYIPVAPEQEQVIAFMRQYEDNCCLVVAPLLKNDTAALTTLRISEGMPAQWWNIFTGEVITAANGQLPLAMLEQFPVAMLIAIS
ncbi:malto-oligosyltrehalose synthase [Chitinophaga sp. 30R24]|uniref:malto-oligosyltrehalose synthase n=1 Tax=Chitinophaga sp. 30R24 TaxID=3248838 RepID=UPI003B8F11B7